MTETQIGTYRLLMECGHGSYGTVYLAENTLTGQRFALKVLNGKHEKRELAGLIRYRECRHQNLLQIHHIDRTADGRLYYTMDAADNLVEFPAYLPDTLANRLARQRRIPPAQLSEILKSLLAGLLELHGQGLIHRDIKPDNIFFVNGVPILGDIGLTANSREASLVGTPQFLPPDVLAGKRQADESSDLYALGKVAYCCLTGCAPGEFPHLPGDLPREATPLLKFCRIACETPVSAHKLLSILENPLPDCRPKSPRRWLRRAFFVLLLGSVIFAILPTVVAAVSELVKRPVFFRSSLDKRAETTTEPARDRVRPLPAAETNDAGSRQPAIANSDDKGRLPPPTSGPQSHDIASNLPLSASNAFSEQARKDGKTRAEMFPESSKNAIPVRLSQNQMEACLAALRQKYPDIPDDLKTRAKQRYGEVEAAYMKHYAPAWAIDDYDNMMEAKRRKQIIIKDDLLYQLHDAEKTVASTSQAALYNLDNSSLHAVEESLKSRRDLLQACLDAEKMQKN